MDTTRDYTALLREAIDAEPYRVGQRTAKLKQLLVKLEPAGHKPAVFPPPMPSERPSLLYQKLRGGRRRR